MGISSGFFDSLNGDRKYNVTQLSVLVSSLIKDGVFQNIGTAFSVTPNAGSEVLIGIGYGFFKRRWIQNDSLYPLNMGAAELLLDRIDAVVIEVDNTEAVRLCTIKNVKGAPSATPVRPALIKTDFVNQYPLAYILRPANNDNVVVGNITQMIGSSECPFVIGVQETLDIDILFAQWSAQWDEFVTNESLEFDSWFQNMKDQLTTDAAGHLQNQIDVIEANLDTKNIKTYTSVTQFGVVAATTTLQQLVDALPVGSEYRPYIVSAATFPNITFPTTKGKLLVLKIGAVYSELLWYPDSATNVNIAPYIMSTKSADGALTGVWTQIATKNDLGPQVAIQETAPTDTTKLWVW